LYYITEKILSINLKMKIEKISEEIKNSFYENLKNLGFNNFFNIPKNYLVGHRRFFGTYYLPYLAELLHFNNERKIIDIGNASLFGRAFVIAQDQAIDNSSKDWVLISPLLLKEFIKKTEKFIKEFHLEGTFNEILLDSIKANKNEQKLHKNKITPYSNKDLQNLYLKTKIVDLPVIILCNLCNKQKSQDLLLSIIRKILVCIQICDDLADVEEDYNSGNYTIPVTHGILLSKKGETSLENMYEGLLLSGLFESLILFVIKTLNEILEDIEKISDKKVQLKIYSLGLRNYINEILKEIEKNKMNERSNIFYNDFTKLKPVKKRKEYSELILFFKKLEPANITPERIIT